MRIAIISDIHGNLPALNSVLNHIQSQNIDQIICLGDLVDFAPWTNEIIETIRNKNILTIMGNHDERIAFDLPIIDKEEQTNEEKFARRIAIEYTKTTITSDNKEFLKTLPYQVMLKFAKTQIYFTHASPQNINEYLYEEDITLQQHCLGIINSELLIVGHTHLPYIKKHKNGTVINVGSVGRTKHSDKKAVYTILDISENRDATTQIVKIDYPRDKTAKAIYMSDIPNFYAERLLK